MQGETVLHLAFDDAGAALDISGMQFEMRIATDTPTDLTTENGGIKFINAKQGKIDVIIPDNIQAGAFRYDLWAIAQEDIPLLSGFLEVIKSVTP